MRYVTLYLIFFLFSSKLYALDCKKDKFENINLTICKVSILTDDVRLYLRNKDGIPFGNFNALRQELNNKGIELSFAMNAGMYHSDLSPVGHFKEEFSEKKKVISTPGPGNFGMLPNGVFCIGSNLLNVYETSDYLDKAPKCNYATQSGPMLVLNNRLHPRFLKESKSKFVRNGVGTSTGKKYAYFVKAEDILNFHTFARIFKEKLKVPNALYLDGKISRLYSKELNRNDFGWPMGPILAVVRSKD